MSMTFYAGRVTKIEHGKIIEPVIPFEAHDPEIVTYSESWDGDVIRRPLHLRYSDEALER